MDELTKAGAAPGGPDDWSDLDPRGEEILDEGESAGGAEAASGGGGADRQGLPADGAGMEESAPEGAEGTDLFTLKHLDDVKTVSREEVVALAQKGLDYDRIRQKYDESAEGRRRLSALDTVSQRAGFRDAEALVDSVRADAIAAAEGIDRGTVLERITLERERQALGDFLSPESAARRAGEKRNRDFLEFVSAYGDVKPEAIAKEVWEDYAKGSSSLVQAYMKHENAELKAALEAGKKALENRERTTGSRAGAGRGALGDKEDELWYKD